MQAKTNNSEDGARAAVLSPSLICTRCKIEKSCDDFEHEPRNTKRQKRSSHCRECRKVKKLEYYYRNRERTSARSKEVYYSDIEASRAKHRQWYADHRAERTESKRRYRAKNPFVHRRQNSKRRAAVLNSEGSHTAEDLKLLWIEQGGLCAYCDMRLDVGCEVDHIIPLSRGGSDDIGNIALACPPCNGSKLHRTPEEWGQQLRVGKGKNATSPIPPVNLSSSSLTIRQFKPLNLNWDEALLSRLEGEGVDVSALRRIEEQAAAQV